MPDFEPFGFSPDFTVEVDPEFPGTGEWGCPVVAFDADGNVTEELDSRWGTPLIVKCGVASGEEWVAMIASDGLGDCRRVYAAPGHRAVAHAGSTAHLFDPHEPQRRITPLLRAVHQVTAVADSELLLAR